MYIYIYIQKCRELAQGRSYSCTSGPKVGIIGILGALANGASNGSCDLVGSL